MLQGHRYPKAEITGPCERLLTRDRVLAITPPVTNDDDGQMEEGFGSGRMWVEISMPPSA